MSKMNAPKMEVVRFNEADVIVASGAIPNTMKLSNWGNNVANDGVVEYGGQSYIMSSAANYNSFIAALEALGANGDTNVYHTVGAENHQTLYTVCNNEMTKETGASGVWNGTYTYDSTKNIFTKKQ